MKEIKHTIRFYKNDAGDAGVSSSAIYYQNIFGAEAMIAALQILFDAKANGECPSCAGCAKIMDIIDSDIRLIKNHLKDQNAGIK